MARDGYAHWLYVALESVEGLEGDGESHARGGEASEARMTREEEIAYDNGQEDGYQKGYSHGYAEGQACSMNPPDFYAFLIRSGFKALDGVNVRWDAAAKAIVVSEGGRDVFWR